MERKQTFNMPSVCRRLLPVTSTNIPARWLVSGIVALAQFVPLALTRTGLHVVIGVPARTAFGREAMKAEDKQANRQHLNDGSSA